MTTMQVEPIARCLRQIEAAQLAADLSDRQLLERYTGRRDEAAFAALVRRHGAVVLGVCRRVLRDVHTAEDAFQATFLVLARKAASIGRPEALGPWLHGVAARISLKARAREARRQAAERQAAAHMRTAAEPEDPTWRDLRPLLDDAVGRLPERLRVPFVLHYLEGRTVSAIARDLGCPRGTVATHLARARQRLRAGLRRRGLTLSASALGLVLARERAAALGSAQAAVSKAVAAGAAGEVPARVTALAQGGLETMSPSKRILGAVMLLLGLGAAGGTLIVAQPTAPRRPAHVPADVAPALAVEATDLALFRQGSRRFFAEDYPGAAHCFNRLIERFPDSPLAPQAEFVAMAARDMDTIHQEASVPLARAALARKIIDAVLAGARAAEAGRRSRLPQQSTAAPTKGDLEQDIEKALRRPVRLAFKDTPLEHVLEDLRATYDLNLVLDHPALEQEGISPKVPVNIRLEGVTLRSALNVLLRGVHLAYMVRDGVLVVTTPTVCRGQAVVKTYEVGDLVGAEPTGDDALLRLIPRTIQPQTWAEAGGVGTIAYYPPAQALVVSQTADVHEQVADFLAVLRRLNRRKP
jgi:RNA polymerase sigma factor (sigma-70 family)